MNDLRVIKGTAENWDANKYTPRTYTPELGLIIEHWKKKGRFNEELYLRFCKIKTSLTSEIIKL